jgi:hypothetical protein
VDTAIGCIDVRDHPGKAKRKAVFYGVFAVALLVVLGLSLTGVYGVRTETIEATGGGYELSVRYGGTTRPALATPFDIEIRRPGGFDGPVTIAVTADYLAMWDENGLSPSPSAESADGEWEIWEFDPPDGEVLMVSFDARIEPAAQSGERGRVEVRDESGAALVAVDFETEVLP